MAASSSLATAGDTAGPFLSNAWLGRESPHTVRVPVNRNASPGMRMGQAVVEGIFARTTRYWMTIEERLT
jgi:hypothetical protein